MVRLSDGLIVCMTLTNCLYDIDNQTIMSSNHLSENHFFIPFSV